MARVEPDRVVEAGWGGVDVSCDLSDHFLDDGYVVLVAHAWRPIGEGVKEADDHGVRFELALNAEEDGEVAGERRADSFDVALQWT